MQITSSQVWTSMRCRHLDILLEFTSCHWMNCSSWCSESPDDTPSHGSDQRLTIWTRESGKASRMVIVDVHARSTHVDMQPGFCDGTFSHDETAMIQINRALLDLAANSWQIEACGVTEFNPF